MKHTPEIYHFTDDGIVPNSKYPVLIYRKMFNLDAEQGANWLEGRFASNNWTNSFRWRIYDYHHYHSNTHEVLGVYAGNALLQLGGEHGAQIEVSAGDVIVLNSFHITLGSSSGFSRSSSSSPAFEALVPASRRWLSRMFKLHFNLEHKP